APHLQTVRRLAPRALARIRLPPPHIPRGLAARSRTSARRAVATPPPPRSDRPPGRPPRSRWPTPARPSSAPASAPPPAATRGGERHRRRASPRRAQHRRRASSRPEATRPQYLYVSLRPRAIAISPVRAISISPNG